MSTPRSVRALSVALAALFAVLLTAAPAAAVTGGQPDGDAHPQVAFIMAPAPEGGFYFCSGSLIAPTVVLTAAHCTFLFSAIGATEVLVSFDAVITDESTFYAAHEWYSHPDYVEEEWPYTVDVGVVILDEAVDRPLALLPEPNLLDSVLPARGASQQAFVDVGYGQTGVETGGGPPRPVFPLERRQSSQRYHPGGNEMVPVTVDHGLTDLMLMLKAIPTSRHGSGCGGDSGGPIFLGDSSTVVAVHTGGYRLGVDEALCGRISSLNHRIDTPVVLNWLYGFL